MQVLLCKPTYFRIEYSINDWMTPGTEINKVKLFEEFEELKAAFRKLGVEVLEIVQKKDFPDMVYTRDWGHVIDNKFILGNFKHKERRGEKELAEKLFTELGFEIVRWRDTEYFEGGDAIVRGDKIYLGWGKRTSKKVKTRLEEATGKEVIPYKLSDNLFYHLDTCFMPLDEATVIYYPDALSLTEQAKISYHFTNPIPITKRDVYNFGCNLVKVGKSLIVNDEISQDLQTKLQAAGYELIKVRCSEYSKGGGNVRCISLLFD